MSGEIRATEDSLVNLFLGVKGRIPTNHDIFPGEACLRQVKFLTSELGFAQLAKLMELERFVFSEVINRDEW